MEGEAGRARAERNLGQRRGAGVGKGRDGEMEKKARESGGVTGGGREKMLMKAATKGEGGTEGGGAVTAGGENPGRERGKLKGFGRGGSRAARGEARETDYKRRDQGV